MYHDIGAFEMIYDEFKEMCRVAWSEKFFKLCIDMTKNKNEGKHRIFNESKTTYIDCIPEKLNLFKNIFINNNVHVFCEQIHSHSFKCCFRLET